jgi:surface antigen
MDNAMMPLFPILHMCQTMYRHVHFLAHYSMQPWVQGAYGAGHVAVVERVLSKGSAIASSMSWGANPYAVVDIQVWPGSGITFIRQ